MKITEKRYEKAKKDVEEARKLVKLVQQWEQAKKTVGNNQKLIAVTVVNDEIRTECIMDCPTGSPKTPDKSEPNVQTD